MFTLRHDPTGSFTITHVDFLGTMSDREVELDAIRRTYAEYARSGRTMLWTSANPGNRRIKAERDAALVHAVADSLPTSGTVLDLGCGTGELAGIVRQQRPDVRWTGLDLIRESIAVAEQTLPWASWIAGSADRIPLATASIDVAIAETLFSSLPSFGLERDVASEIERVVKPGGWLVWYDIRRSNPRNAAVHGVGTERIDRLFPEWSVDLRTITLLPPLARRLGRFANALYRPLGTIPGLRTHFIGRLGRPISSGGLDRGVPRH